MMQGTISHLRRNFICRSSSGPTVWERLLASNPNYPDRAKVQKQIAELSAPGTAIPAPAQPNTAGVEGLLEQLKSRQK